MSMFVRFPFVIAIVSALVIPASAASQAGPSFAIVLNSGVLSAPARGRIFVALSRDAKPEPRELAGELATSVPFFGLDVRGFGSGAAAIIDAATPGYPTASLRNVPAGDYYAQAIFSVYTRYPRADGHVIWAHQDRWEGQQFGFSPGNPVSDPVRIHFDPRGTQRFTLRLSRVLPPIVEPPDTAWVKHVKIRSNLLTKFWGVPQYLGAIVLLPKGYASEPNRRYPAVYVQGHFSLSAPFGFDPAAKPPTPAQAASLRSAGMRESRYAFTQEWTSGQTPPMVAITFQHPTPYYDDSYAVDSVNNGPYGTAIMTELIPYLESHFRLAAGGNARFLIGGSTGGWEALALQIYHPDDFNGTWGLYPDPVDFHRFQLGNLYSDPNAFYEPYADWNTAEIGAQRAADGLQVETMRGESRLEFVRGSHGLSTEQFNAWDAAWGPIRADGYPREFWDKHTGVIDRQAVLWSRDHGYDLAAYLRKNWSRIGPSLAGKIHVDVGDQDDYYLNLAVYLLQDVLDGEQPAARATFDYGRPLRPHGYQAKSNLDYLREMYARVPASIR